MLKKERGVVNESVDGGDVREGVADVFFTFPYLPGVWDRVRKFL